MINIFDTSISEDFESMLNGLGKDIKINNVSMRAILNNTDDTEDTKIMKLKESINRGDIIEYNNQKFICLGEVNDKRYKTYNRVKIQRLNHIVKFYINNKLEEIPCIIEVNSIGTKENQWMSVIDGNIVVTIQDNEITNKLQINNQFIKFKSKWEITGFSMELKGLMKIYSKKIEIGGEDNRELEIANYYKHEEKHEYSIEVENELNLKVNDTKQLAPVIKDIGKVVTMPVIYSSSDNTIAQVSNDGLITCIKEGTCKIKVALKDNVDISQTINLTIKFSEQIEYKFEKSYDLIPFYSTKEFIFYKFINSIKQVDIFTFSINYGTNNKDIATLQVVNGNSCKITGSKKSIAGTIILEVRDSLNNLVGSKEIRIKYV